MCGVCAVVAGPPVGLCYSPPPPLFSLPKLPFSPLYPALCPLPSVPSWGGNIIPDPAGNLFHLFVAEMVNHCPLQVRSLGLSPVPATAWLSAPVAAVCCSNLSVAPDCLMLLPVRLCLGVAACLGVSLPESAAACCCLPAVAACCCLRTGAPTPSAATPCPPQWRAPTSSRTQLCPCGATIPRWARGQAKHWLRHVFLRVRLLLRTCVT